MEQQQAMEREKEVILLERKKLGRHHTLQVIKINIINSKPYWYHNSPNDVMRRASHLSSSSSKSLTAE